MDKQEPGMSVAFELMDYVDQMAESQNFVAALVIAAAHAGTLDEANREALRDAFIRGACWGEDWHDVDDMRAEAERRFP